MATVAQTVSDDELELYIENEHPISAEALAHIVQRVVDLARSTKFGGPDCEITIVDLRLGSLLIRFRISAEWANAAASLGLFALAVAAQFNGNSDGGISAQVARMISDSNVTSVVVTTKNEIIRVEREELQAPPLEPGTIEALGGPETVTFERPEEPEPRPAPEPPKLVPKAHAPDRGDLATIQAHEGKGPPLFLLGTLNPGEPPTFTTDEGVTLPVHLQRGAATSPPYGERVRAIAFVRLRQGELFLLITNLDKWGTGEIA